MSFEVLAMCLGGRGRARGAGRDAGHALHGVLASPGSSEMCLVFGLSLLLSVFVAHAGRSELSRTRMRSRTLRRLDRPEMSLRALLPSRRKAPRDESRETPSSDVSARLF